MQIKNIQSFRKWFKDEERARQTELFNEDFMGVSYKDHIGFFGMYHGAKDDIYGFLRKEVEMAEDGQAIYEFVQNAADSNSTHFYMFFNEKYFIAINNGEQFTKEGIKSILNIGQSYGKTDSDKIGRYGIGFKLVHRLVGKSSGLDEILNKDNKGYRGPILFSWSDKKDIKDFLELKNFSKTKIDEKSSWLLKILLTNFPSMPNEKVKDYLYDECIPFPDSERKEFQNYLNSIKSKINLDVLDSGTIFFIKLGEGKYEYLSKQQEEYTQGLSTSMHFLKSLEVININGEEIIKNTEAKEVIEFITIKDTEEFKELRLTEERDKDSDVKFNIIYSKSIDGALEMQNHPNIYKYFPAVKEVNKLSLFLHSNVFELTSNRQNLQETELNKKLLKLLSLHIINRLEKNKKTNKDEFRDIFASILLSEEPDSYTGSGWQKEYFSEELMEYIKLNIPTNKDDFKSYEYVLIKKTKLDMCPSDFGIEKEWLFWNKNKKVLKSIKDKLDVEEYSLKDLLEEGEIEIINSWIKSLSYKKYEEFLQEFIKEKPYNIQKIKFIKCNDNNLYSLDEVFYHSDFIKSNNYQALSSAIEILTGYKTPNKEILDILNNEEFKIENDDLFYHLDEGILDNEDAKAIIEFVKKTGEGSLFKVGYFEEKDSFFKYQKNSYTQQYYFNKKDLNCFIKENLSSSLSLLPSALKEFQDDKYILKNDELYKEIMEDCAEDIKELVELLPAEYLYKLINKLDTIKFNFKEEYTNEDFEYQLLENSNDNIIEELRDKLLIDEKFTLKEALTKSEIVFDKEGRKYKFNLKEILPESDYYDNADKILKISKSLEKAGISSKKLEILFNLEELTDDDYHQIKENLLDIEENTLKNTSQLAFVLLYHDTIKNIDLSEVKVIPLNEEEVNLNSTLYIEYLPFIDKNNILDLQRYENIDKLLKLKKDNPQFYTRYSNCKILIKPFFDVEKSEFICKNIKTDLEVSEKEALLEFIFAYWEESNQNKRDIKEIDWLSINDYQTIDILGFEPKKTILGNDKLVTDSENPPEWLENWVGEIDERKEFLRDFKIITSLDEIYKLRQAIIENREFKIGNIDEELLENTLDWIVEKEIVIKSESYNIVENIANRLEIEFEKIVDKEKLGKDSIPFYEVFKSDYYKTWSEEFEYEIYFYDGEIPHECIYKEYKLKVYQDGDQILIDNIAYLNQNTFKEETDFKNIVLNNKDAEKKLIEYKLQGFSKEIEELRAENNKLKEQSSINNDLLLDEYSDSDINENMKKEVNKEAREIVKKEITSKGYDCSNWNDNNIPPTIIKGIKYNGENITLVIKSAEKGGLYLHPNEWNEFDKPTTHLIVSLGGDKTVIIDKDIKERIKKVNETFLVKVDIDKFGIEEIDKLSEALVYKKGASFIFKMPGYSYSESLKNTNNKNEGELTSASEDEY